MAGLNLPRTLKEFLILFGPLALGICIASSWFLHTRNKDHRERIAQRQETIISLESRVFARDIANHASDARFLARLTARRLDSQSDAQAMKDLEKDFRDFAQNRQIYSVLRFLDKSGLEGIRLDRSPAGLVRISADSLQDKRDRYYFKKGMLTDGEDVYISHFYLNMEHGRIESPLNPTLRFSCPVLDNHGQKTGLVVLNCNGKALLDELEIQTNSGEGVPLLTTGDGFFILGEKKEDEWGHLLKESEKASMPNRFPKAWAYILAHEKGQILTSQGLFTFDTIAVIPDSIISAATHAPEKIRERWKIMTMVSLSNLSVPWVSLFVALIIMCLILLSAGCWHLADSRITQADVERKLRRTEEKTRAISESAMDAIAMIDDRDKITYWNPSAERLFGYRAEEVFGLKLHDLLAPKRLNSIAHTPLADFSADNDWQRIANVLEFNALCKDGSQVPVELAMAPFRLKGKKYAVGSMRDISRRKRDEMELRRTGETIRALLNAPTESAMLVELDGTILAINDVGAHRLGGSVEEITGKNAFRLISPKRAENRKKKYMQALETGMPSQFEDAYGDLRLQVNVYPTKSPDGSVDRLAVFARDVTKQREAEKALRVSQQRFKDVSEAVSEYIWETNLDGAFTFVTHDVTFVLGYTPEELLDRTMFSIMPEEDIEDYTAWRKEIYGTRESFSNKEIRNITKDDQIIWLQISGVPYYDEDGRFEGYRGAAMNITDRKTTENAIKTSERTVRALSESAYDAIVMIDTNGLVSFWNHAAEKLFGYSEEETLGKEVHSLIAPPDLRSKAEMGMYEFALTGKGAAMGKVTETFALHKDGTRFPVERSVSTFQLGENWCAVATIRDITERKTTEAKLKELATIDDLTGINNRRRFMELSEREFARSLRYDRPLALFMMDIDHFKTVNDTHGHDVGDEVLRSLSKTAVLAIRNADIMGRLGGEEFGVLLPETARHSAVEVAERLRTSVEQTTIPTDAGDLSITVSIGVACLDPETNTLERLLKRADVALYEAKQSGRNRTAIS